jgi:serralysin
MSKAQIRQCVDRLPPLRQADRFARLAAEEWRENLPVGIHQSILVGDGIVVPVRIAFVTAKKWKPGRTLRVAFLDGRPQAKSQVKAEAVEWCQHANIGLEFVTDPRQAEIRISFRQQGAWSYIGTDALGIPKNQPTMNYGFLDPGVVLHEFGHALACIHEHQHPEGGIPWNREAVYRYYGGPPNNWDRQTIDQNIFARYGSDQTQFSQYDPTSIMHDPPAPALLTDPSKATGWNKSLSARDKEYAATIYPSDGPPPTGDIVVKVQADYADGGECVTEYRNVKKLTIPGYKVTKEA